MIVANAGNADEVLQLTGIAAPFEQAAVRGHLTARRLTNAGEPGCQDASGCTPGAAR